MRSRALPLAACASLLFFPDIPGARAADLGGEAPIEDATYDFGDADYVAPSPVYVALRGAVSLPDDVAFQTATSPVSLDHDAGLWAGAAVGVDLEQTFDLALMRGEIEVDVLYQSADAGDTTAIAGFISLYRDLGEFYRFRPYVGAGVGLGHVSVDAGSALDDDGTGFAFHVTSGVSMEWTEEIAVDIGYRFTSIMDVELTAADGTASEADFNSHALFAGVRFRL
ncbi:MAG: outer membrane protein [Hyphomicrobiaceae bacterium]